MLRYLLDTNVLIALLRGGTSPVTRRIRERDPAETAISSIAMHELYYGACRSERIEHNLKLVDGLLLEVIAFDRDDAREAGAIRAELAVRGTPIGPYDVLMAGQARGRGLTLVTANAGEFVRFVRVEGLAVEESRRAGILPSSLFGKEREASEQVSPALLR